jgi:hypothetical protein
LLDGSLIAVNDTSSSPQVWERIAYFGIFPPINSSKRPVLVLMSLIVADLGIKNP